jgi:hypothetical protein
MRGVCGRVSTDLRRRPSWAVDIARRGAEIAEATRELTKCAVRHLGLALGRSTDIGDAGGCGYQSAIIGQRETCLTRSMSLSTSRTTIDT